ncbi:hypothetical protein FE257_001442 [Aspergillus nanangensis]|uniref:FAD-binding FR-type domain-containing protein n=1 Tax=Aspergillus nanangensis TaxID=2582783 RepID=A0AAD4GPN8_ASPNN|nr:hypothetical protein FE257_001442 [Aspergillus nanangensis]
MRRLPCPCLLLLSSIVILATAQVIPQNQLCINAVYTAYGYISFSGSPAKGFWQTRCQNVLEVTSIYAAAEVYCRPEERDAGFPEMQTFCRQYTGLDMIPREQLAENLTEDAIHHMRVVNYLEVPRRQRLDAPVLVSRSFYQSTFDTLDAWQFETWSHHAFGYAGYAYWAIILAVGMVYRLVHQFLESRRTQLGPNISTQILRYVADRTGIVSFANFPLIWLFAGRNNIFIWATGWSFATFNLFHRHVAWIATIQGLVHTVLYLVLFIQNGNAWRKLQKPYLFWGTIGMVAMFLLLPTAMDFFRRRTYEVFLVLHILLSIATLVGCFYHTIIFEGQEYWVYLWPAVAIWGIDRSLRIIRLVYCNLHVHWDLGKGIQYTRSTAVYDKAADVIRLEVIPGSLSLKPTPGQYYFLYQPFRFTGWESHPFTLGAWTYEPMSSSSRERPFSKDGNGIDTSQVPLLSDSSSSTSRAVGTRPQPDREQLKLIFWIRPFDGWTRHLRGQCMRSPDRTVRTKLLLEGPYAEQFPLWNYESVLLVAGGTGIAAAVPYIQEHLARSAGQTVSEKTHTQDIHLVWTTRQEAFIQNVVAQDLSLAFDRDDFNASFYVTSHTKHHEPADEDPLFPNARDESTSQSLNIAQGRPDLRSIMLCHAQEAQLNDCSAAVVVCGPPAMADEARLAVHSAMRQGYDRIRYVEESFSW